MSDLIDYSDDELAGMAAKISKAGEPTMNERRLVELAIPLIGIVYLVERGILPKHTLLTHVCMMETMAAIKEVKGNLTEAETAKRWDRVRRGLETAMPNPVESALKYEGYGLFYMLKVITDADYFVLGDEDRYRLAVEAFLKCLAGIEMGEHDLTRARSRGRGMLQTLQALGYYRGIEWPDRFDD